MINKINFNEMHPYKVIYVNDEKDLDDYVILDAILAWNQEPYKYICFDKEKNHVFSINRKNMSVKINLRNLFLLFCAFIRYFGEEGRGINNRINLKDFSDLLFRKEKAMFWNIFKLTAEELYVRYCDLDPLFSKKFISIEIYKKLIYLIELSLNMEKDNISIFSKNVRTSIEKWLQKELRENKSLFKMMQLYKEKYGENKIFESMNELKLICDLAIHDDNEKIVSINNLNSLRIYFKIPISTIGTSILDENMMQGEHFIDQFISYFKNSYSNLVYLINGGKEPNHSNIIF